MTIQVKFFASLRERVGLADTQIDIASVKTAEDIWQKLVPDIKLDKNILISINMDYVAADHPVKEGDEVAFFPPVTGG